MRGAGHGVLRVLAAAFALCAFRPLPAQAPASASRAVLIRGPLSVRGVPHLPPNSVQALYGEYRWGSSPVRAWILREELFIPGQWSEFPLRSRAGAALKAFTRPGEPESPGFSVFLVLQDRYWILVELPASESRNRAFLSELLSRLAYFASRAKAPTDLSFPAILEIR